MYSGESRSRSGVFDRPMVWYRALFTLDNKVVFDRLMICYHPPFSLGTIRYNWLPDYCKDFHFGE